MRSSTPAVWDRVPGARFDLPGVRVSDGLRALTRKDFSFLGGFLFVGLMGLIGTALIAWVASAFFKVDVSLLSTAISMVSVLLFSGYVLFDTSNMLHRYSTDMVVPAALALMIDFIILFRDILFLLLRARD
jgi:modulator of FtsH protease